MRRYSKNNNINAIIGAILAIILLAGAGVGTFFLITSLRDDGEREPTAITSQVTFRDDNAKFSLEKSGTSTTLNYTLTANNEASYLYANIYTTLPDVCYRYDEIYITFTAENIDTVTVEVGGIKKTVAVQKGNNTVNIAVKDWGKVPRLLIYPDTHGTSLATVFGANKTLTITEVGFYEPV